MTSVPTDLNDARDHLRDARHKANPFLEKFARFGYVAKGVVYVLVGGLAAFAAVGSGGQTTGSKGALAMVSEQPFGRVMLGLVAFGLCGYALWQFIRAVEDPENEGSDGKAIARRIGFFISGVIHFGLVWYAIGIITGAAGGGGGGGDGGESQGAQTWSAKVMQYPMGQWLLLLIGLGIIGYGIYQLVKAFKSELGKHLRLGELDSGTYRLVVAVSRFGLAARGVVFGIIGGFLALAAYHHNAEQARGLDGALETLQRQPYGPWLLGTVAVGLIAYGIFEFVKARYRQINPA